MFCDTAVAIVIAVVIAVVAVAIIIVIVIVIVIVIANKHRRRLPLASHFTPSRIALLDMSSKTHPAIRLATSPTRPS